MTVRLSFDLSTCLQLAEHAAAAAHYRQAAGPALLLHSDGNGVHLTSNGLPALPPAAGQPAITDQLAVFAEQCPPGTPWLDQIQMLGQTPLAEPLPVHEPTGHPLIEQLLAATRAGHTTLTVLLSGTGLDLAVSRRRHRTGRQPARA
jgi:hypothetical protein